MLVRLGDDGEEGWNVKKVVLEGLMGAWRERLEWGNWVLPVNDGRRGKFDRMDMWLRERDREGLVMERLRGGV